jgi:hypothetical protein
LKGKIHRRRAEKWIRREDSAALIAHKTNRILELLKAVNVECFAEHETHYKCQGFFQMLIEFLESWVKTVPLPDLSGAEDESFSSWRLTAVVNFAV